jgi:hypothetical protein
MPPVSGMTEPLFIRIGDRVQCVDAGDTNKFGLEELIIGAIYTISWIGLYEDRIVVRVKEFDRNEFAAAIGKEPDEIDFFSIVRFWPLRGLMCEDRNNDA